MVYLDNAATSYPKPQRVYDEIDKCLREYCANPGRSGHQISIQAGKAVYNTRELVSNFFNIGNPMQVCFTKNATEALNIAIKGVVKDGDHVITTVMEHNSVLRPLMKLKKTLNIEIDIVEAREYGYIYPEDIKSKIKSNTRLIVCTSSSNVNGIIMPISQIGKIARENGILFLLDASQGAGTIDIDMKSMDINILAFPGHKALLGPQGTGGLCICGDIKIDSLIEGGTGSFSEDLLQPEILPDKFEGGTINTPGVVGLGMGIDFINGIGIENIRSYKHSLLVRLLDGLKEIRNVEIYSKYDVSENSGIVALNIGEYDSSEVCNILDRDFKICARGGLQCAPLVHRHFKTLEKGIVRLSIGCFNSIDEIDETIKAIYSISCGKNG